MRPCSPITAAAASRGAARPATRLGGTASCSTRVRGGSPRRDLMGVLTGCFRIRPTGALCAAFCSVFYCVAVSCVACPHSQRWESMHTQLQREPCRCMQAQARVHTFTPNSTRAVFVQMYHTLHAHINPSPLPPPNLGHKVKAPTTGMAKACAELDSQRRWVCTGERGQWHLQTCPPRDPACLQLMPQPNASNPCGGALPLPPSLPVPAKEQEHAEQAQNIWLRIALAAVYGQWSVTVSTTSCFARAACQST